MREKIEKSFGREIKKEPEEKSGLALLKEEIRELAQKFLPEKEPKKEIKELIKKFSADTFKEAKEKKTKEIDMGEKGGIMKEYPTKVDDFREEKWFQKLSPEKQERVEFKITNLIHKTAREESWELYNKFLEKLPSEVREYFKENERRRVEGLKGLFPSKKLEGKVIEAIEKYKKQFGFPPGEPTTLRFDCTTFTNFVGKLFEHYGFKSGLVDLPSHVASLVELKGNKRYVSDVYLPEPLPLRKWIKGMIKERNIKIGDIATGYFGGYESYVYSDLGTFLWELKRDKKAEKEFREAIRINPNNPEAHNNLGVLLFGYGLEKERFPEAEKEYRKAIKIKPNYPQAHYNLGLLYKEMGRNGKAREEILKARELYEEEGMRENVKKCNKILLEEIPVYLPK